MRRIFSISVLAVFFLSVVSLAYGGRSLDFSSAQRYGTVVYENGRLKLPNMSSVDVDSGSSGAYPFSVVRVPDGTVMTAGCNRSGQLGNGTTVNRYYPPGRVLGPGGSGYLTDIVSVAVGYEHVLALRSDGTVWAWGLNDKGQLGVGDYVNRLTPVQVPGLTGIVAISAGSSHSLALAFNGMVWSWGYNGYGQLGIGSTATKNTPQVVIIGYDSYGNPIPLSGIVSMAAGFRFSLALSSDGRVYGWGDNRDGELGRGTTSIYNTLPAYVMLNATNQLTEVVAIGAVQGNMHSLFLRSDGTVWACGSNYNGALGQGTTSGYFVYPVQVKSPDGGSYLGSMVSIASAPYAGFALKSDGTLWAWGYNIAGQLGDGTSVGRSLPVQVKGPGGVGFLTNVIKVFPNGSSTSFALRNDGSLWGWGGSPPVGAYSGSYTPVRAYTGHAEISTGITRIFGISISASDGIGYQFSPNGTTWYWRNSSNYWEDTYGNLARNNPKETIGALSASQWSSLLGSSTTLYIRALFHGNGQEPQPYIDEIQINEPTIENFSFTGTTSIDVGGTGNWTVSASSGYGTVAYRITLPDQSQVNQATASYQFNSAGTFTVKGRAYLQEYPSVYREETIEVTVSGYVFPDFSIRVYGSLEGVAPFTVLFSAEGDLDSIREYNPQINYIWDFGDGGPQVTGKRVVGHPFKISGDYTVTLRVEDNYGNSDIDTVQVVVSMPQDLTVRHFKAYYSNPYKRVPLKVIVRPVIEYMPGLERVVQNQWTVGTDFVASNRNMLAFTFNGPGDYNINFEGVTNYGRSLLGGFSVTVNPNQLPQCTMEYQDYPTYGYTKFTPFCMDPDGRVRSYFWDFGNGETSKTRTGYAHYNQSGTYNVRLTVKDDSGDEASIQWDVVVER